MTTEVKIMNLKSTSAQEVVEILLQFGTRKIIVQSLVITANKADLDNLLDRICYYSERLIGGQCDCYYRFRKQAEKWKPIDKPMRAASYEMKLRATEDREFIKKLLDN